MKAIYYLIAFLSYIIFIMDRIILSVTFRTLSNFPTWAELHLPDKDREHKKVKASLKRVLWVILAFTLFSLISCTRKDYQCDCDYIHPVHGEKQESFTIEAINKQSASEYCEDGGGMFFVDFECKLR